MVFETFLLILLPQTRICGEANSHYNKSEKKKILMFRNIISIHKRHSTLGNRRQSDSHPKRIIKSIDNLKISQVIPSNLKREQNHIERRESKMKLQRLPLSKQNSNKCIKEGAKMGMKLQITPFYQRITLSTSNSVENQIGNQIKQRIEKEIIPQIIDNHQINKKSSNYFTYRKEDFIKLLHKTMCLFLEEDQQQQDMAYLTKPLRNIKKMIIDANKRARIKKHRIEEHVNFQINQGQFRDQLMYCRFSLERLSSKKSQLSEECSRLQSKKTDILQFHQNKIKEIDQKNQEIVACARKLQQLKSQKVKMEVDINQKEHKLANITEQSNKILNFVETQKKNQIVKLAGEHYKQVEADIYEYAVYLQANQLANSLTYESVPHMYHRKAVQSLQESLQKLNKTLIQESQLPIQEKYKMMRDFVTKLRDQYSKKDVQQQKMIKFKTKCIINFVEKMKKWLDNWTLKQEYLVNLRSQFSLDSQAFQSGFNALFDSKQGLKDNTSKELFNIYLNLKENYLMGNSFY